MKYNKSTIKKIADKLRMGATHLSASLSTGICEETFYAWMKKPEFSKTIKAAEAECQAKCEKTIQIASLKSWQAAAWYLERRQPETYALKQRLEHSGIENGPITVNVTPAADLKPTELNANDPSKSD